ncbi:unnamed protein product [Cuscuta campestris]|uniref:Uncharacterized protein n=1 Tax=Cuscuta campestris TaxID=132261 RepID=A0A484KKA6_9ASTE|nr:unnamed protein product [Cuscuta campestris]
MVKINCPNLTFMARRSPELLGDHGCQFGGELPALRRHWMLAVTLPELLDFAGTVVAGQGVAGKIVACPLWSVTGVAAGTRRWIESCRVADLPEKNSLELMLGFGQTSSELAGSRFPECSPSSPL